MWRVKPRQKTSWKYRGQVTPEDRRLQIEVHFKEIHEEEGKITVIAEGSLWNDSLRIYHVDGLALEANLST
jgi:3-hydroxymyristoyl/3-hydroxydecanoyl-(acyl carrier protein) dehydratase